MHWRAAEATGIDCYQPATGIDCYQTAAGINVAVSDSCTGAQSTGYKKVRPPILNSLTIGVDNFQSLLFFGSYLIEGLNNGSKICRFAIVGDVSTSSGD